MALDFADSSLELELSCPICLHLFSDPITLCCGHSFCMICLEESQTSEGCGPDVQHYCPECRAVYQDAEISQRNLKLRNIVESYKNTIEQPTKAEVQAMKHNGEQCCSSQTDSNKVDNTEKEAAGGSNGCALSDEQSRNRHRLTLVLTNIQEKSTLVNELLVKVKEREAAVKASHTDLRTEVRTLLEQMVELLRSFGKEGIELLDAELKPRETTVENMVHKVSDLQKQLKDTELQVNTLLEEHDDERVNEGIEVIEACAAALIAQPVETGLSDMKEANAHMTNICVEMERQNEQLRLNLGAVQRRLRAVLNPSEVTFDSETLHPRLSLSDDLKTVTFSVAKQSYTVGPKRFISFLQALSSQSFFSGEHCWVLKAEGCSWVLGVCYGGLPRSGPGSGLESSSGAWCLMWCDNLLRAYEGGKDSQLMRTPSLRQVEIRLSFNSNTVAFYSISNVSGGKTHLHTFRVSFTEPVYLAVRMMSGQPKAQITLCK